MANIIIPKPWQLKYSQLTEEKNYHNRREALKKLGLTAGAVLAGPYIMSRAGKSVLAKDRFLQEDNRFNFEGMEEVANRNDVVEPSPLNEHDVVNLLFSPMINRQLTTSASSNPVSIFLIFI